MPAPPRIRRTAAHRRALARLAAIAPILLLGVGCATRISPAPGLATTQVDPGTFSHAALDRVLGRFVDERGRVDYRGLAAQPEDLDRYYAQIGAFSPESHPALFPDPHAELAYWLNAYNGAVLKTVLAYYPIESVRDVRPPPGLFFLPRLAGFFYLQRVVVGGREINLYHLEHRIVIDRYRDPRVHFALNCASIGCPRLPRRAFDGARLENELEAASREFVAETRNVEIDPEGGRIVLSSIFDWYEDEFVDWQRARHPEADASLRGFIGPYLEPGARAALEACAACRIEFTPYDWGLNDQARGG